MVKALENASKPKLTNLVPCQRQNMWTLWNYLIITYFAIIQLAFDDFSIASDSIHMKVTLMENLLISRNHSPLKQEEVNKNVSYSTRRSLILNGNCFIIF